MVLGVRRLPSGTSTAALIPSLRRVQRSDARRVNVVCAPSQPWSSPVGLDGAGAEQCQAPSARTSTPHRATPRKEPKPCTPAKVPSHPVVNQGQETLVFRPIELPGDGSIAVRFCEDAFVCSFGTAERFWAEAGRDGKKWVKRLHERLEQDKRNAVNAWLAGHIVGQVILGRSETLPRAGHVNLYYLVPKLRGLRLADQLDSYAIAVLRDQGYRDATLAVSPTNKSALHFYLRRGWRDLGPCLDAPYVHAMERTVSRPNSGVDES
jgi:GNAT superfamily N-acetyltransferase